LGQAGQTRYRVLETGGRAASVIRLMIKGGGTKTVVGSQAGASNGSRAGLQRVQGPGPQPAPRVGPTPAPAISTSKRKNVVPQDVPRPRPPPKPGARPSPSSASRAVHALAATAAASHNMNFVPRHLAAARLDVPQVAAWNRGGLWSGLVLGGGRNCHRPFYLVG